VIVGAGPGGSSTAAAIGGKLNVLMIDAKSEPGKPIHCAGGIARYWLDRLGLEPPRSCFAAHLHAVRIKGGPPCSLSEVYLRSSQPLGYVLYRDRFDAWLCERAQKFDVKTWFNTAFRGLSPGYVKTSQGDVKADIIVGADGPLSMVGHAAGLPVGVSDDEMCAAIQYLVELPDYPQDEISLFFGERIAPGGYAWVFPYGCFSGRTCVLTEMGWLSLQSLVEGRLPLHVVGLDYERGHERLRLCRILSYHQYPLREPYLLKITLEDGRFLEVTVDNELRSDHGWVKAEDLKVGQYLSVTRYAPAGTKKTSGQPIINETLDCGGGCYCQGSLPHSYAARVVVDAPSAFLGSGSYAGLHPRGDEAQDKCRALLSQWVTNTRPVRWGVGLHSGNNRWRGNSGHILSKKEGNLQAIPLCYEYACGSPRLDDEQVRDWRSVSSSWWEEEMLQVDSLGLSVTPTIQGDGEVSACERGTCEGDNLVHRVEADSKGASTIQGRGLGSLPEAQRVRSIERSYTTTVYDLTTETGTFVANGVIVHNSGLAEVGVGCVKSKGSPKPWLHRFLNDHKEYVGCVVRVNGGLIPLTLPVRQVWTDNVVLVGEAARLTVSSHGGGIAMAVRSGQLLGRVLAAGKPLSVYERALKQQLHPFLTVNYLVKLLLYGLTDWQLREVLEALGSYRLAGSEPNPVKEIPKALLKVMVMRPFLAKRAVTALAEIASSKFF